MINWLRSLCRENPFAFGACSCLTISALVQIVGRLWPMIVDLDTRTLIEIGCFTTSFVAAAFGWYAYRRTAHGRLFWQRLRLRLIVPRIVARSTDPIHDEVAEQVARMQSTVEEVHQVFSEMRLHGDAMRRVINADFSRGSDITTVRLQYTDENGVVQTSDVRLSDMGDPEALRNALTASWPPLRPAPEETSNQSQVERAIGIARGSPIIPAPPRRQPAAQERVIAALDEAQRRAEANRDKEKAKLVKEVDEPPKPFTPRSRHRKL